MVVISPYDKGSLAAIEKAIRDSDLGVNPTNDGNVIRVVFPELTEERRKEYIKVARHKAEDARVSIRNIRRHAKDDARQDVEGRRRGRGRGAPRGEASSTTHAQVRRAGRRAAQAQGSRAARGLTPVCLLLDPTPWTTRQPPPRARPTPTGGRAGTCGRPSGSGLLLGGAADPVHACWRLPCSSDRRRRGDARRPVRARAGLRRRGTSVVPLVRSPWAHAAIVLLAY